MTKLFKYLLCLLISFPLTANEIDQLKQKVLALEIEQQKLKQSISNQSKQNKKDWINLSGTRSYIRFSGFLKLDFIYDIDAKGADPDRTGYTKLTLNSSTDNNIKGHTRIHARQSKIIINTLTNTDSGSVTTVIEGDFYGNGGTESISNSSQFRFRKAYGAYQGWLLGMDWSNYVDVKSFPESLDLSNDTGQAFLRQSQIRYTHRMGNNLLSFSLENPESDFIDDTGTTSNPHDKMPDITLKYKIKRDWGHFSSQAVFRKLGVHDGTYSAYTNGYGIGISGSVKAGTHNLIRFHLSHGDGIGRYIQEALKSAANVTGTSNANLKIETQTATGGYFGFQHKWTTKIRTNLNAGLLKIDWDQTALGNIANTQNKKIRSFHTNIIFSPVKIVDIGIETIFAERILVNGDKGDQKRIQISGKYSF